MQTPKQDGFFMPGEFEVHKGCILIWPSRPGSWRNEAREAKKAFAAVIEAIARSEAVFLAARKEDVAEATNFANELKRKQIPYPVTVFEAKTDDAWARDIGPTFVVSDKANERMVRAVNWEFNAWGGEVDGLYAAWKLDNAFAKAFSAWQGYECYDAAPFVLEGGSIHSDGEGTVLVTASCLLSKGRNPELSKKQIEEKLKSYLGAEKILWLPRGIYLDETNEHVDNVCAFLKPGEVVLAWTDNEDDPQYVLSKACLDYLESECDAKGRKLVVHKLPYRIFRFASQKKNWKDIALKKEKTSERKENVWRLLM